MTRILFVYHVSSVGGGSYCLLSILKAIDRTLFEPMVLLPQKGPLCDEIEKLGIEIVYFPSLVLYPYNKSLFKWRTLSTLRKIQRCQKGFAEVVRRVSPDIVYMNTMMLFPYLKTVKECGCKTVLHVREHWPLEEHRWQLERVRKIVYKYADKLIAINRYSASIFPEKKAAIVYDWIDMDARRGGPSLEELLGEDCADKKVYLFTGGLQPIKGTIEVLRAFSREIKGDDRRLLVLGVDSTMNWSGIRGKIKKVLSLFGYKTYKERVIKICEEDSRIICRPSMYNITELMESVEGYISYFTIPHANLALAESIIVGTQAIAAQTDEAFEYSNEGKLALLFPFGDEKTFIDTWRKLDIGQGISDKLLKEGAKSLRQCFSSEMNAYVFNQALKELVS